MPRYSLLCLATTWLPNVDVASHVYIRCCVYAAVCATTTMMMMIVLLYFLSRFHSALPLSLTLPSECASEVCILIQFFLIFVLLNKCAQVFVFSCVRVCRCMYAIGLTHQAVNVCQIHRIQVLFKHILRTCIRCVYISNFCVCYGGQTHTNVDPHALTALYTQRHCAFTRTHCNIVATGPADTSVFVRIFWIPQRLTSLSQVYKCMTTVHSHERTCTLSHFSCHCVYPHTAIWMCACTSRFETSNSVDKV